MGDVINACAGTCLYAVELMAQLKCRLRPESDRIRKAVRVR